MSDLSITYERIHQGTLFRETNKVSFYGMVFPSIVAASKILRELNGQDYCIERPFKKKTYKGYVLKSGEVVAMKMKKNQKPIWFCDEYSASIYCRYR